MFKKSLQTITWGDPQHHLFDHIFGLAASTGFEGLEIGFRRLGQISIEDAKVLLNKHDMSLSACHVGGNLADLTQATSERAAVDKIVKYLVALDCDYLIYSGLNATADQLKAEIERLRNVASGCANHGKKLLFHNHDWEFKNDQRIWNQLLDAQIDGLGFALDLGWAVKGGKDMSTLLDEVGDAVDVLHIKDFISWDDGQNTCHLGDGVVDFAPIWAWLAAHKSHDIWVTAEQDNAVNNDKACAHNAAYLSAQLTALTS